MVPRDSTLPVRTSRTFSTSESTMRIKVIEGKGNDKRLLHKLLVDGILPMPRRLSEIVVTFHVDGNGSLTVSAVEKLTGKQKELKISGGRLPASEVGRMRQNIEDMFLDREEELRVRRKLRSSNMRFHSAPLRLSISLSIRGRLRQSKTSTRAPLIPCIGLTRIWRPREAFVSCVPFSRYISPLKLITIVH